MTSNTPQNAVQTPTSVENKPSDKELNFRALETRYQKQLEQERAEREKLQKELEMRQNVSNQEEDEDKEPYVDHKKLNKTLNKFGQNTQSEIQKAMEIAKQKAKEELKQELWLESNPDFYEVLQHAEKFAQKAPKLAETILRMPEGFERQKLVYENIKELGINKPAAKEPTVQEKIDANRKSPYYQPSGIGTPPYAGGGDFSPQGQKTAYDQMQALKARLKI